MKRATWIKGKKGVLISLSALIAAAYAIHYPSPRPATHGMTAKISEAYAGRDSVAKRISLAKIDKFYIDDETTGKPMKQQRAVDLMLRLSNLGRPTQAFPPERIGQKKLIDIYWATWRNNQVRRGTGLDPLPLPVICVRKPTPDLSEKCSSLAGYGWNHGDNYKTRRKEFREGIESKYWTHKNKRKALHIIVSFAKLVLAEPVKVLEERTYLPSLHIPVPEKGKGL